jgi:Spy/CpxP family protein refolding chaperone
MKKMSTTLILAAAIAVPSIALAAPAAAPAAKPATTTTAPAAKPAAAPVAAPAYREPTQAEMEAALAAFRAIMAKGMREVYKDQLDLSDEEGKKFWPIYDKYEAAMKKQNDELLALIKRYATAYNAGPVDDATAKSLLKDMLAHDKDEMQLRDKTVNQVMGVLPATKAALFAQIDNKVRVTIKYDLAKQIPLIE